MESARIRLFHIYEKMAENKCFITAEGLRDRLLGKDEKSSPTLLSLFEEHNEEYKKLIGIDFTKSSVGRYITCCRYLKEYMLKKYRQEDILLKRQT